MSIVSDLYAPNDFKKNAFFETIQLLARTWKCEIDDLKFEGAFTHEGAYDKKPLSLDDVKSITGIKPPMHEISIHLMSDCNVCYSTFFKEECDAVDISIHSDDYISAKLLLKNIVDKLDLTPCVRKFSDDLLAERIGDIESRLSKLETRTSHLPLKCFLSYRFSDKSKAIASEIEKYLTLLGVKVVTGDDYEPKKVEDKVRERLLSGVDFIVYIVTSEGESAWLRDEIATATANNAYPIPLVEAGSKLEEGMLGSVEYIDFASNHPGDSWIKLAQAVNYISENRIIRRPEQQQNSNNEKTGV